MQNHSSLKATSPLGEWLCYLENSHFKAIDLGLERVKSVAQALDLLRPAPFVITVGGTNGKGTTCRLLETILLNAGYRVGVYSSPHLICYNERVRIQNQELPDAAHSASFAFIDANKTQSLTYFEFSTLSALYLFKQAQLDVVILEVGLGGRLDATNIVDSDLAVITSIDIDHTDFLGSTREQIAFEKAGIFRAHKMAIIGEPDVPQSLLDYAAQIDCPLSLHGQGWQFATQTHSWHWQGKKLNLRDLPLPQIPLANAATALATVEQLPFEISQQVIRDALQQVQLNGRFQAINTPEQLQTLAHKTEKLLEKLPHFIVDVGHNPHAARYLAQRLQQLKAQLGGNVIAVCGILQDKDAQGILQPLFGIIEQWHFVTLSGPRGQTGEHLRQTLLQAQPNLNAQSADSVVAGVQQAVQVAESRDVLIVFGSFHTVGEFWQWLQN